MSLNSIGSPAAAAGSPALSSESQTFRNFTLDDASPILTYKGFFQNQQGPAGAAFDFSKLNSNTVSYTTSAAATASFQFTGVALYVYGLCGPEMASFSVTVDSRPSVVLTAAAQSRGYNTLLFAQTQLDAKQAHTVLVTNTETDKILALDYFLLTSDGSTPKSSETQPTGSDLVGQPGPDSTGAIVGGIIGGLVAILLLWIWYRYRRFKAAGGKGNCREAFLGIKPKPIPADPPKPTPWINWPMLSFKPKYDDP